LCFPEREIERMKDFDQFVLWERATRDTIDVKKTYIDMVGDLVAGILLSQIVYWYLPKEDGSSRLRVEKDGHLWIAKGREDWWDETRISPKQFDRCIKILEDHGLVVKETFKFDSSPTVHIRLIQERFMELWNEQINKPIENPYKKKRKEREEEKKRITEGKNDFPQKGKTSDDAVFPQRGITDLPSNELPDGEFGFSPKGNNDIPEKGKSLTEITVRDSVKEREREDKPVGLPPSESPSDEFEKLEFEYQLLQELTKRVFGLPRAYDVDVESIWNHWKNRFPQYDLGHIYAVMRATQSTARVKDDLTGIIVKRLPSAMAALVPLKQRAYEYIAELKAELKGKGEK
jgi:hypothetical protein